MRQCPNCGAINVHEIKRNGLWVTTGCSGCGAEIQWLKCAVSFCEHSAVVRLVDDQGRIYCACHLATSNDPNGRPQDCPDTCPNWQAGVTCDCDECTRRSLAGWKASARARAVHRRMCRQGGAPIQTARIIAGGNREPLPRLHHRHPDFDEGIWEVTLSEISSKWVLRQIPIDRFRLYAPEALKRTEAYEKLTTQAPAIIAHIHDGFYYTLDGEHRLHNAKARGDVSILAFVPEARS